MLELETQFLPGSGRVDTAVWMHNLDTNKTAGEEARRQFHKHVASNIEQVKAATPYKSPLYGHLPPITKTIQVRRTRHAGHCCRSWDELISDVLLWTPTYSRVKIMRWLTNFYDFRFKWTATVGIGIHPTKVWLSQLGNFKNAIWTWGHFRRTICNKVLF